jgi:hypothetical protein
MNETARIQNAILKRRGFLKAMGAAGLWTMLPKMAAAVPPKTREEAHFVFTRIEYDKGDWNADMLTVGLLNGSEVNLLQKLNGAEFDFSAFPDEYSIHASDPQIFDHPFLYITGHGEVDLTVGGRQNVKQILENGGFLLADNCCGAKNVGFDRAIRNQLQLMFPETSLQPLPTIHPVYKSHYPIDRVLGGDKRIDPYMEGLTINGRTAVIYTINDLGCAWEGHPCRPGGEPQRVHAFKMGINIVFYALSGL